MPTLKSIRLLALSLLFGCAFALPATRADDPFTWTGNTGILTVPGGSTQSGGSQIVIGGTADSGAAVIVSASIIVEPGALFSIANSAASGNVITSAGGFSYSGTNGGAFLIAANSTLTLTGTASGPGGGFLFDSNTASGAGGAIYVTATASVLIDSATFTRNVATGNGGAIASTSGVIFVSNALFTSNTGAMGGAIYDSNPGSVVTVRDSTFRGNYGTTQGGAIAVSNLPAGGGNTVLDIKGSLFDSNTAATNGGAIFIGNGGTITIASSTFINNNVLGGAGGGAMDANGNNNLVTVTDVLFKGNKSASNGGAFVNNSDAANTITFTNVSFLENIATGTGGAIFMAGQTTGPLTLKVTSGTSLIAGNKAGGATGTSSGIFFNNQGTGPNLTVDVSDGATLDMLDPLGSSIVNAGTLTITQTGAGLWNLGGTNALDIVTPGNANANVRFTVASGTLHLYRAGESALAPDGTKYTTTAPTILNIAANATGNKLSYFSLGSASTVATLSAGGGNIITTSGSINIFAGSTIALDLTEDTPGSTSILTLNAGGNLNVDWTNINLSILGLDNLVLANGQTYNLITLGNSKTFAGIDLAALTANTTGIADTYSLQLDPANSNILQLLINGILSVNNVLTWNGAAGNGSWTGTNWIATDDATPSTFHQGDIINLASADNPPPATSDPVAINLTASSTINGMYLSGAQSYTITGRSITADASTGDLATTDAATGKLILGAIAANDAGSPDTTAAYTGTLTLNNTSNNFTGGIEINTGALVGSAASLNTGGDGSPGITIADAGSLTFNQVTADTYAAPIRSAATAVTGGNLVKTGGGALVLAADNSAFTGQTTVNAGSLLIPAGATLGGNVAVNNAGTFGGAGTANSVTLNSGAALQVGIDATSPQNLSLVNLTLNAGSLLSYTSFDNTLLLSGNLTQNGASTINFLGGTLLTNNPYTLIDIASGFTGNLSLLSVSYKGTLLDPTTDYTLAITGNYLQLTILNVPIVGNNVLTWNGAAGDNLWLASKNWVTQGVTKAVVQADIVNLGGTSAPATAPSELKLTDSATVAAMYVSGNQSYAITGAGSITADGTAGLLAGTPAATGKLSLGKTASEDTTVAPTAATFTGTLDLTGQTGTNNFAGGVEIASGALRVSTTDQLGTTLANLSFQGSGTATGSERATLQIASGANITFDGGGTSAPNSLALAANSAGDFILEDNATLTFSNNSSSVQGAVANLASGASLTLVAGANSQYIITSNTSTFATGGSNDGGVFYLSPSSTLTLTGTDGGGFFIGNNSIGSTGSRRGGAIFALGLTAVAIDSATFTSNVAAGNGGAIFISSTSTLNLANVLFTSNTGAIGGAIAFNTAAYGVITSATFSRNTSVTTGGAIGLVNSDTVTITDALFRNNNATTSGGAISVDPNALLTLNNVSFLNNTAAATGGAIYNGGTVIYNVTTSATVAGNTASGTAGASASGPGASVYFFNSSNNPVFTVNVAAGAELDMLDPMGGGAVNSNTISITMTGDGLWNLGGSSSISPQNINNAAPGGVIFTVASGTLHLYRANEGPSAYPATTGNIYLTGTNGISASGTAVGVRSSFNVNTGATLSAGGGNTISANQIFIQSGATIALDLSNATRTANDPTAILTLTTIGGNPLLDTASWTQNLLLLNFDANINYGNDLIGSTYNLITLGNGNLFSTDDLGNLLDRVTGLLDGYTLQLSDDSASLQLVYNPVSYTNSVLTWNGLAGSSWVAANWTAGGGSGVTFNPGDIINLANTGVPAGNSINVDTIASAAIAGMYLSGNENYTITGRAINADANNGSLAGSDAATGKLILGAKAADDASSLDTSDAAAYTGTLILSNSSNNFAGGIDINSGALVGNAASLGSGAAGITIADAGSLTFDQATAATYTATIRDAAGATTGGSLAKTGAGALTLAADNSGFTGQTAVNAGSLLLAANAALGGNVAIASDATFGGAGTAGTVTVNSGGNLQVGIATTGTQTLSLLGNLTLSDGSLLTYTSINHQLLVGGDLIQNGASTINLHSITSGSYSIFDVTGGLTGFDTSLLTINYNGKILTPGDEYTFDIDPGNQLLWLIFDTIPLGLNNVLTWTGAAGDGAWLGSRNWTTVGVNTTFTQNDIINLAAAEITPPADGSPVAITLADNVTAAAMYVSGTQSYAISGPGGITITGTGGALEGSTAANGRLTLGRTATDASTLATTEFSGILDFSGLTGANHFENGVQIRTGSLRIANTGQLGAPLSQLSFTGTGALIAAAGGDLTFDGNFAGANRLAVGTGTTVVYASIIAEPGATFTIENSYSGTGAGILGGGAIFVSASTTLVLSGVANGGGGGFLFASNTTPLPGGALYMSANSNVIIDSATFTYNTTGAGGNNGGAIDMEGGTLSINNSAFTNNMAGVAGDTQSNGGAIGGRSSAVIDLTNVLFASNTANGIGGAIFDNTNGSSITIASSTFSRNTATSQGGAIAMQMQAAGTGTLVIDDSVFRNNISSNGGAIWFAINVSGTITNSLFQSNTSTGIGGAISMTGSNDKITVYSSTFINNTAATTGGAITYNANYETATFVDTSFYNNTAGSDGGAIYLANNGGTLALNVSSGSTATIAGNNAVRGPGLFISNNTNMGVTVNTDAGGSLNMLDPFFANISNNSTDTIVKNGDGTWNLGGSSTVTPNGTGVSAALNITIAQGTFHLYRAGEVSYNGVPVAAGSLTWTNTTAGATFGFAVNSGATLSAGGGNIIAPSSITLQSGANLALDFNNATPISASNNYSILTLSPVTLLTSNGWTQALSLLNLDAIIENNGDVYNLITLTGAAANSPFTSIDTFNLLTTLPQGYHLQLSADKTILQLLLDGVDTSNHVLTWTGNLATGLWTGYNWTNAGAANKYRLGDIVNLANPSGGGVTPTGSTAINVNVSVAGGATISAMYVSGTENFGITGAPIVATTGTGTLGSTPAATGKLILGAKASEDANSVDTSSAAAYTGTLTFSNSSNTFTGGIEINSGALVGNAANLGSGAPGVTIGSAGALTFDQTAAAAYDATIRGAGALVKTGTAALTLTANNSAFTGQASVNLGALLLDQGASLGGSASVASGATFGGGNATAGAVTLDSGATLQVGIAASDTNGQSLTLSALTLGDSSLLNYTRVTNTLLISGNLAQTGSSTINLGTITSGSYALISASSGISSFDTSLLDLTYKGRALEDGVDYIFGAAGNNIWLTVLNPYLGSNHVITWTGAASRLWLTALNWKNEDGSRPFIDGDAVNFTGEGSGEIQITGSATFAGMYVSGNASYSIVGDGSLIADGTNTEFSGSASATGKLVLGQTAVDANTVALAAFNGTLDLTGQTGVNNFQNGVDINTGALRISSAGQLGAPLSKLNFLGDPAETIAPATINIAAGSAVTFDGAGSTANRLVVAAGNAGQFIVEDGATLTFAHTTYSGSGGAVYLGAGASLAIAGGADSQVIFSNNSSANDGAAIYLANGASFAFTPGDGASILFDSNKITGSGDLRGGAIFATTGATVHVDNATFSNNTSRGNGGAAGAVGAGSLLEMTNVLFVSNTALNASHGGAIMVNTNAAAIITNGTFANNYSTGNGGAILAFNGASAGFTNVLFASNTAAGGNGGGAMFANTSSVITVQSGTFIGNSGSVGGALSIIGASSASLSDVSIINNTALINGGAIYMANNNTALSMNVSAGNTVQVAGNTSGTGANIRPNSIYLSNNNNYALTFFTDDGASLDMVDPMYDYIANGQTATVINKTGAGTWNLGGSSTFQPANANPNSGAHVDFNVQAGTLHLYREGEMSVTSAGAFVATAGNIILSDQRATLNFNLYTGAVLSAGGGNTITASSINLATGATIALDLNEAFPDDTAILTLNAASSLVGNGWNQYISLINLATIDPINGDVYNLIALGNNNRFTTAANFLIADDTLMPDGYSLILSADSTTLQLLCTGTSLFNLVTTWNGAAGDSLLTGSNWTYSGSAASYHKGNILNFSDIPAVTDPDNPDAEPIVVTSATVNINTAVSATISAIYVSGTTNYTITGNAIVTTPYVGTLVGTPADTGKLTLGALAFDDASGFDTDAAFTGTLTFSNTWNNFTGGIEIYSGALVGNATTLNTGTAGIDIAAPGSITFVQATSATIAAPLTGEGAFNKTGAGTLILASADTNFAGTTQVAAGALLLGSAAANYGGDIHVANAATFGGLGSAGNVALDTGATFQIGLGSDDSGSALQPVSLSSLSLADRSILNYASLETPLIVAGDITQVGTTYINVAAFKAGSYDLGNLATTLSDANTLVTIAGDPQFKDARQQAVISTDGDNLFLNGIGDASRVMTWTGGVNNTWAPTAGDWANSSTNVFAPGDQVIFDDTAAPGKYTVTVYTKGVTASDMFVTGSNNYTFTGGAITTDANSTFTGTVIDADGWTGKLYKSGDGTLILANTSNNFLGGIELTGGTITFQGSAANVTYATTATVAPGATLQFAGATLKSDDLQLGDGSILAGSGLIAGAATLNGIVNANIGAGANLILSNTITSANIPDPDAAAAMKYNAAAALASATPTGFLKTGLGTLTFNGADSLAFTGATQIDQGTVNITGINGLTSSVVLDLPGGTYNFSYDGSVGTYSYTFPGGTYNVDGKTIVVPDKTFYVPVSSVTGNSVRTYVSSSFVYDGITYVIPSGTVVTNDDATQVIDPGRTATGGGVSTAGFVTNNFTLNGGTLAFGVSGSFVVNEATANDWKGITLVQGDNAAASVVTGTNDIVYIGAGTFAPALQDGLTVVVDPGEGNTAVFSNTANTFLGAARVDSGTLQVSDVTDLGAIGSGPKLVLNTAAVQFSGTGFVTTGNMEVRGDENIVNVDDGANVTWAAVNRTVATAPNATLVKVGSGTFTITGTYQPASLTVAEGRWVATSAAGAGVAATTVDVREDAVFELAATTSGTVVSSFMGSGTLLVSSGVSTFTSPNITIDNIYIGGIGTSLVAKGGGVLADFSPKGTITVDQGSLVLGALNQNVGNVVLNNGATLSFFKNLTTVASTTLTADTYFPARYENNVLISATTLPKGTIIAAHTEGRGLGFNNATLASLSTDGVGIPQLLFNVNLAEGLGDHLTVIAPVSGTYDVGITKWGAVPAHYTAPIELLKVGAGSDAIFNPSQPEIDLGFFKYAVTCASGKDGSISLLVTGTGAMSNSVNLVNSMAAMMPMSFFSELDSVAQRMGDLHFDTPENAVGFNTWLRTYGDRINYNQNVVAKQPFNETIYGGEAGIDYKFGASDRRLYAGYFMGYSEGQRDYSIEGDGTVQSVTNGGYLTFTNASGWYVDGVLKLNTFKNRFTAISPTGERTNANYNNWALGGSLEIGKYVDLGYDWYVIPQVQCAHTVMQGLNYTTDSDMFVELHSGAVTRGRVGVMVGRVIETSRHGTIRYYFKAYGGGQWTTGGKVDVFTPDDAISPIYGITRMHYASTIKGYNFEGGAGISWLFNKTTQLYFDYTTTDAEYYVKPWGLNLGIRRMW